MGAYGDAKNKKQLQRRFGSDKAKGAETADWSSVDANAIRDALAAWSQLGGALRLGYTSDGGAYAIGVYGDGEPYTIYIKPSENVEETLEQFKNAK